MKQPAAGFIEDLRTTVGRATAVVAVGARTQFEVGGPVRNAIEVRAPAGIVDIQPADMTVTVHAGTSFAELDGALAEHGQECPLDPADPNATVGGILCAGLSGWRRLGLGPIRDTLLEVVFVTADGRIVRGGGPTVKNVTGYDIPRLFVGSLGTLGIVVRVILRTRPRPPASEWFHTDRPAAELSSVVVAPTALLSDGTATAVWLQGHAVDIEAQAGSLQPGGLQPGTAARPPVGAHRARVSIDPQRLPELEGALRSLGGVRWLAEYGVGTMHVATDEPEALHAAREAAVGYGGWLLRTAGAPELDPFGTTFPGTDLQRRVRQALDPDAKLSPGRVPATEAA